MTLKKLIRRGPVVVLALLALALPSTATADSVLIIQFSGLDMVYFGGPTLPNGGLLCDAVSCNFGGGDPASSDPLASMTFGLDTSGDGAIDVLFGTETTDLWADVSVAVGTLPTDGTLTSGTDGTFDLLTNDATPGWGVALDIDKWGVQLFGDTLFFFGGGSALVTAQDLPIPGIGFDETMPVQWSFSTQVTNLNQSGGNATSFNASGTGEIRGPYVPEPGTLLLLGGGLVGLALLRRRRR